MAKSFQVRFAQLLIKERSCRLQQVNQALQIQRNLRDKNIDRSFPSILLEKGFATEEHVHAALARLGVLRFECEGCSEEIPVSKFDPSAEYSCPRCQGPVKLSENLSGTRRNRADRGLASLIDNAPGATEEAGADSDDPIIDKVIDGCQILRRLAAGGMGVVYKARQLKLGRTVAVKVLSEDLARDKNFVHRFLQEARSAAELNHGNIVHIFDVGELAGVFYIIMEFVDGKNLREILDEKKRLDSVEAIEIALQASHALKHAHKRGIIHRDIKPENIMLTRDNAVKIADLGLAKKLAGSDQDSGITCAGAILGTPYYMAPEQVKDFSKVDGRTDIYSLGVTLYKALTGKVPFKGRTPVEVMINVVEGKYPPLRSLQPDVPEDVAKLVERMMHVNQEHRFHDLSDVIGHMETVLYRLRDSIPASDAASPSTRRKERVTES